MITELDSRSPVVREDRSFEPRAYNWMLGVTRLSPLIGTGSPEGAVEAFQGRIYMDSTGSSGSILYIKRDADIAGNRTMGWVLV